MQIALPLRGGESGLHKVKIAMRRFLPSLLAAIFLLLCPGNQMTVSGQSAVFAGTDTNTQGNWVGTYGSDGYDIANGPQSPANGTLPYGTYAVQNQAEWTWAGTPSDKRALEIDAQGGRTAATWYSTGTFSFDLNFTDASTHQVAVYVLDWDSSGQKRNRDGCRCQQSQHRAGHAKHSEREHVNDGHELQQRHLPSLEYFGACDDHD